MTASGLKNLIPSTA